MAYTPVSIKPKVNPSNFGGLVNDGNRNALTGVLGSYMQSIDATATPVGSPLTATGSTQTLTVPENAAQIVIYNNTSPLDISEDSSMTNYFVAQKGQVVTIDVSRMQYIYIKGTLSDTIYFYFNMV